MEPEIQRVAARSPTSKSMRIATAASTPPESHPDWCTPRRRWVCVCTKRWYFFFVVLFNWKK